MRPHRRPEREAAARLQQEREQFAARQQRDHYNALQTHLASAEPVVRLGAVRELARLAITPEPGTTFPYFAPVADELAGALYLEGDAGMRVTVREAITDLVAFAKPDASGQPLLLLLIGRLVNANRRARDNFIAAFAAWSLANGDWNQPGTAASELLVRIAPFCRTDDDTRLVLEALTQYGKSDTPKWERPSDFDRHRERLRRIGESLTAKPNPDLLLHALETAARQLIDTRDALTEALKARKTPPGFPLEEVERLTRPPKDATPEQKALFVPDTGTLDDLLYYKHAGWRRTYPLDVTDCFLSGANLGYSYLRGADMYRTFLHGAALSHSHLEGVDFCGAQLQNALLKWAEFYNAKLMRAALQGADLEMTRLQGADFGGSDLRGVDLAEAQLQGAFMELADLRGVDLRRAKLQGAILREANLQGANLSHAHLQKAEIFSANLQNADLSQANLYQAGLSYTHLEGTDLRHANLYGVTLAGAHIREQDDEDGRATVLPANTLDVAVFGERVINPVPAPYRNPETERLKAWLIRRRTEEPNQ